MYVTKNFVFIHFPRTGGSFLQQHLGQIEHRVKTYRPENKIAKKHVPLELLDPAYKTLPKFTVLRDPLSWYWSFFCHQKSRSSSRKVEKPNLIFLFASDKETLGFEEFLSRILNPNNLCPNEDVFFDSLDAKKKSRYLKSLEEMRCFDVGYYSVLVKEILYSEAVDSSKSAYFQGFNKHIHENNLRIFDFENFPNNIINHLSHVDPENAERYAAALKAERVNASGVTVTMPKISDEIVSLVRKKDAIFTNLKETNTLI